MGGFVLEKLLLEEWEWWYFAIASIPFALMAIGGAYWAAKMETPTEQVVKRLARNMELLQQAVAEPDEGKRTAILAESSPRVLRAKQRAERADEDFRTFWYDLYTGMARAFTPKEYRTDESNNSDE